MAVFGTGVDRPLYGRGPSAGLRCFGYAALSIALMYYDQHGHLAQRLRFVLDAVAYPVQVAVSSPGAAWRYLTQNFQSRDVLRIENQQLRARVTDLELRVIREAALEQENNELRALRQSLPPFIEHWQLAEVISVETNPLRQRIVINKGTRDGVVASQAVIDGNHAQQSALDRGRIG
jgi:rod shape-determining protein MreC